ncbi:MAG TPA: GyrI-like domain-containing protein [Terriglobales bacterium]|nr:GyrI-like domain-containing protein [Terriglobales bacterium]
MKTDLVSELKALYTASAKSPSIVTVPKMKYLTVDGHGHPDKTPAFQEAASALFQVAYTLKFMLKKAGSHDFKVMPLEGFWWPPDGSAFLSAPDDWNWTLMIALPSFVTVSHFNKAIEQLRAKKKVEVSPALDNVHVQEFKEGKAVQMLHIGPYSSEEPTVTKLGDFATDAGFSLSGRHHEIYLSDPKRTPPEKLKTIIRYSIVKESRAAVAK